MLHGPLIMFTGGALMLAFGIVLFATGGSPVAGWLALTSATMLAFSGAVQLINHSRV